MLAAQEAKDQHTLVSLLRETQQRVHKTAVEHGFWETPNSGEKIALIHQELSELLEALRAEPQPDKHLPLHDAAAVEIADTIIRLLDFAEFHKLDVAQALIDKAAFNETRPYKHGKKF